MIVVTGGSGFIGSALVWQLNQRGLSDIVVVDHLGTTEKWRNLVPLRFADYLDRGDFITRLEAGSFGTTIEAIFHLGACSSTTETDTGYLMENNYRYTARIAGWWQAHPSARLIYASSAATYGDGAQGYSDDELKLEDLRPLNMYGYSKQLFDLVAKRNGWLKRIVGLKYFNVFGPNENHKGEMRSVIGKSFGRIRDEGVLSLFRSYREGYGDGEQRRDFVYVKDAVAMTLFFFDNPQIGGLYNIGTGIARSWNDLAAAMFGALHKPVRVDFVPMPEGLRPKYQYFTQADLTKLRAAGCLYRCMTLEDAVKEYITEYLVPGKVFGE